jgi:hypothetical protein
VEVSNVIHILQNKAVLHQVGDKNNFAVVDILKGFFGDRFIERSFWLPKSAIPVIEDSCFWYMTFG